MGAPPSTDEIARMMSDPVVQQSMNAALDNPDFINMLINSNPTLRNLPNAREMLQSPFMRQMMTNPEMLRMAGQMHGMEGQGGMPAFPAPGATDNTPAGAPSSENPQGNANANATPGAGANAQNPFSPFMFMPPFPGFPPAPGAAGNAAAGQDANQPGAGAGAGADQAAANPFLSFLGPNFPGAGAAGNPDLQRSLQELLQGMGAGSPPAPVDNRPPEERYADQLRQLNDMGFYDFDRNVAALRRSGGSVQGAVEHLLGGS